MRIVARLWRNHRTAFLAFAVAFAVTLFFTGRLVFFIAYWSDPDHRDQVPEGWMTPGYVARSWQVPREAVFDALGLPGRPEAPLTLRDIAEARGIALETLLDEVSATILALRHGALSQ